MAHVEQMEQDSELHKYKNFCSWREEKRKKRIEAWEELVPNSIDALMDEIAGFLQIKYFAKPNKKKNKKKRKKTFRKEHQGKHKLVEEKGKVKKMTRHKTKNKKRKRVNQNIK
jgi:hypothetical protein